MSDGEVRAYPYRWIVLAVYMLAHLTIQTLWICFAPILAPAASYYGVTDLGIGFFMMSFMIVYIPLSIPISWLIDTLGIRKAVGAGVLLMGVFGVARGLAGASYGLAMVCTVGIAIAQPFLLNSVTTVAAKWFPLRERATAGGLALFANFVGTGVGQVTSPLLAGALGIPGMLLVFGGGAAASSLLFLLLAREAPPTPPCAPGQEARALVLEGLGRMLRRKELWVLLAVSLVGMGAFNGVATWIEDIVRPHGLSPEQAGTLGGVLLLGGLAGAVVFPPLSDRLRRRKAFLVAGLALAVPSVAAVGLATTFAGCAAALFAMGFFLVAMAPILFQYGAELTFPAPEGTSNGLLNLAGQASVVFVYAMEPLRGADGSFTVPLLALAALLALVLVPAVRLPESEILVAAAPPAG